MILAVVIQTLVYSNYGEAWAADEMWSSIVLVFIFWSCVTSYKGAKAAFAVTGWKARLWFLIIPVAVYVVALGVLGFAYSALESA